MELLSFGDIFRYAEKEYIFLAKTEERIYAAQILTSRDTKRVDDMYQAKVARNQPTIQTIYCYVILQTAEFKNRAAHLHNTGNLHFEELIEKLPSTLNVIDLKSIKEEIMKKNTISLELKELTKDIPI